eukprot:1758030-Alexandrium_andersonii.AAC.1
MSASLVGSEMCIRDRPMIERREGLRSGPKPIEGRGDDWEFWREASAESVSYTHLTLPTICSV